MAKTEDCPRCALQGEIIDFDQFFGLIWYCQPCSVWLEMPMMWAIDPNSGEKVEVL